MATSHREQKKQQTRQALIQSAYSLFTQKGYNATTLADITAGANCAPRTFFQYFNAKDDLLLVGLGELWDSLAAHLSARGNTVTTLESMQEWLHKTIGHFLNNNIPFLHIINQNINNLSISAETRQQLYSMGRMRSILIPEFAKDLGVSVRNPKPRLLAAATAAVFDAHNNDPLLPKITDAHFIKEATRLLGGMVAAAKGNT